MLRKTLTILSLIGLILSVGLWAVSFVGMGFYEKFSNPLLSVSWVAKGSLHIGTMKLTNPQSYASGVESNFFFILGGGYHLAPNKRSSWHLLPIWKRPDPRPGEWRVSFPLYIGILLFGAYPLWKVLPFRRRRKRSRHRTRHRTKTRRRYRTVCRVSISSPASR